MSIASSMSIAASAGSSTKITQTALLTNVRAAHNADPSFATQLSALLEYMATNSCDIYAATLALAPHTVAIVSPSPSVDSELIAHSMLCLPYQKAYNHNSLRLNITLLGLLI